MCEGKQPSRAMFRSTRAANSALKKEWLKDLRQALPIGTFFPWAVGNFFWKRNPRKQVDALGRFKRYFLTLSNPELNCAIGGADDFVDRHREL